jgi:heme/copper-type cytochrome/quinol oxidase subunit 2
MNIPMIVRDAISSCFRSWRPWLLQFFANPALFGLFAVWLLIPVARGWQLALNVLIAAVFLAGVLVLHGGTMTYFHDRGEAMHPRLRSVLFGALRNVMPVVIFAGLIYFSWTLLDKIDAYQEIFPAYLRSVLPVYARRHVTLHFVNLIFAGVLFSARWILIPGLFLPLFLQAARLGFGVFSKSSLSSWRKSVWSLSYWALLAAAAVIGVLGTAWLMGAKPDFRTSTYNLEMSSLIVRLSLAYLLGLSAWMLTCSLVGRQVGKCGQTGANISGNASA